MNGCLQTQVRKQPIIALYFESETVLKFYNLEARLYLNVEVVIVSTYWPQYCHYHSLSPQNLWKYVARPGRAYPGSEFVVANTLAKWKKLEPFEINFSQGFSQKVISFNQLFCI